jgi:hypothetical protein
MPTYPSSNDREFDLLRKIAVNTAELANTEAGDVASIIAGTGIGVSSATGNVTVSIPPSGTNGYVLTTTAGVTGWAAAPAGTIPSQTNNSGKVLTTDGVNSSWTPSVSNASAPRNGLSFSGSAVSATATLGSAIGASDASIEFEIDVPTANPSALKTAFHLATARVEGTPYEIALSLLTSGQLIFFFRGASGGDSRYAAITSNLVTTWGGQRIKGVITRTGATLAIKINDVTAAYTEVTAGTPPAWSAAWTGTLLTLGQHGLSYSWNGFLAIRIWNRLLAADEQTNLYRTSSPAGANYNAASNTALAGSDLSTWTAAGTATIVSGTATVGVVPNWVYKASLLQTGKRYRIVATTVTGSVKLYDENISLASGVPVDFTAINGAGTLILSSASTGTVAGVSVYPIGLLLAPDAAQSGGGLTWYDTSGNAANITLPATGVTWNVPTSGRGIFADGTAAAPSISFAADTDTGFYRTAANTVGFASAGSLGMRFSGSAIYGPSFDNYLLLDANGSVSVVAAGTNRNITLTPSGTGNVTIDTAVNTKLYLRESSTNGVEFQSSAGGCYISTVSTSPIIFRHSGSTETVRIFNNGRLGIGTGNTDSGALLQVGTNLTTTANGMVFGTDTFLFRKAAGVLAIGHATTAQLYLTDTTGNVFAYLLGSTNLLRLGGNAATAQTRIDSGGAQAVIFDTSQNATFAGTISGTNITASSGAYYAWTSKARIKSPSDGVVTLLNAAETDFTRLQFGGVTSSFPALSRSGVRLVARLADDSSVAELEGALVSAGAAVTVGASRIAYGGTTATTVGAAGAASALPATPLGYIIVNVAGTSAKIPYYNA